MNHFEDTFKRKADHRHHNDHGYYRDHRQHHDSNHGGMDVIRPTLIRIFHNKTLLVVVGAILVLVIIAVVALVGALLPLASKFIGSIDQNGLKGALDTLLPIIKKLWEVLEGRKCLPANQKGIRHFFWQEASSAI